MSTHNFYEDATGAALEIQRELREAQARLTEYQLYYGMDEYAANEIGQPLDRAYNAAEFIRQAGASKRSQDFQSLRNAHPYPKR